MGPLLTQTARKAEAFYWFRIQGLTVLDSLYHCGTLGGSAGLSKYTNNPYKPYSNPVYPHYYPTLPSPPDPPSRIPQKDLKKRIGEYQGKFV